MNQPGARVNGFLATRWILLGLLLLAMPAVAFAGTEITGVIGGLIGGDLTSVITSDNVSISRSFSNAPVYGVRIGVNVPFIQLEGSFVTSPHGLSLNLQNLPVSVDSKVYYLEANALFVPIPALISPFITAGFGLHHYSFALSVANFGSIDTSVTKVGYNFGGGIKINIGQIVMRGEVRDHITPIAPEDFGAGDIAHELGFNVKEKLHNVEISGGVGIKF